MGDTLPPVTTNPANTPAAGGSTPPAGYWVNPANTSQWLTQADAAKVGSSCLAGFTLGSYAVGGNYQNTTLYCHSSQSQTLLSTAAVAGLCFVALPKPLNVIAALGFAAWGLLGLTLGQVAL